MLAAAVLFLACCRLDFLRPPTYVGRSFALILRCFSVIEGIALRVDPTYSIVGEVRFSSDRGHWRLLLRPTC